MVSERLPCSDAVTCLMKTVDLEKQIESILEELQVLHKVASNGAAACIRLKEILNSPECTPEMIYLAERAISKFYSTSLTHTHELYALVTAPNLACGLLNPRDVQRENFNEYGARIEGVFSFTCDGNLYIKTPPLPAKANHGIRQKGACTGGKSFYFFNRSIDESLNQIDADIPRFSEQNISYISVFTRDSRAVPDCDNIDTKSITDMICLHTMCDDSPLKTSFFYAGFPDDTLPSGTYICVSEGRFSVPGIGEILMPFRRKLGGKKV